VVLSEFDGLNLIIEGLCTDWDDILRSTFNINSDKLRISLDVSYYNLTLVSLVKWKLENLHGKLIPLDEHIWNVLFVFNKEFDESYFKGLSLWFIFDINLIGFNSDVTVGDDAFSDNSFHIFVNLKPCIEIIRIIFTIIIISLDLIANLIFCYRHISFCQGSCFAYADIMQHSASLNTFQVFDKNFIFLQIVDGESHGD